MIKNVVVFRIIVFMLLVSFAGCVTSKIEYVEPEKIPVSKTYRISMINLKNGTAIDVKEKEAKLRLKHKGMSNVIVYCDDVNIEKTVLLRDVAWLKIEILESNQIATVLVVIGTVAATILLAFWLILATGGLKM